MKKKIIMLLLVFFLLLIYIYTLVINYIPDKITLFEGEELSLKTFVGIGLERQDESLTVSSATNSKSIGKEKVSVNLFDKLLIKNIDVSVIPKTKIIPVGSIAGLKLYTNGVLVVGMSEIYGVDNKAYKPYENSGIEEGDTIVSVNEDKITSTEDLIEKVNSSNGNEVKIEYIHQEKTVACSIKPAQTSNNEYKLGLWVRDSAAGVGTVSFYEPSSKTFGALGHGITV